MLIVPLEDYRGWEYPLTIPENAESKPALELDFERSERAFFIELLGAKDGLYVYEYLLSKNKMAIEYTDLIAGVQYQSITGDYRETTPLLELMKSYCFVKYLQNSQYTVAFNGTIIANTNGVFSSENKVVGKGQEFEISRRWNDLCEKVGDYYFYCKKGYYTTPCVYEYLTINYVKFPTFSPKIWTLKTLL